jgi:hypothetical protein
MEEAKKLRFEVSESVDGDEYVEAHGERLSAILNSIGVSDFVRATLEDYEVTIDDFSELCIQSEGENSILILVGIEGVKQGSRGSWASGQEFNRDKKIVDEIFCRKDSDGVSYYAVIE